MLKQFYAENPSTNPDYGRIVNENHTKRLAKLIDGAQANIVIGGKYDIAAKYVEPTVVAATTEQPIMESEIFGPSEQAHAHDCDNEPARSHSSHPLSSLFLCPVFCR